MGFGTNIDNMINEKLLNLHTNFIGKVVRMQGADKCTVQPLDKAKAYGQAAKSQAVISNVPILNHVRHYTLVKQSLSGSCPDGTVSIRPNPHPEADNEGHLRVEPLRAGDVVLCAVCERDITSSSQGVSAVPPVGHHQIGNAVVVGLLGRWGHE